MRLERNLLVLAGGSERGEVERLVDRGYYITDLQRHYKEIEPERLKILEGARELTPA